MVIALPRLQTATTKRCENASASVKHNYRSLPVGPRLVRMIDVSTYEGADFMGDRLRHVGSAVPRTSGLAEPRSIVLLSLAAKVSSLANISLTPSATFGFRNSIVFRLMFPFAKFLLSILDRVFMKRVESVKHSLSNLCL